MSDDEDFMLDDGEDYDPDNFMDDGDDFEDDVNSDDGNDDPGDNDPKVAIENQYYMSKDLEEDEGLQAAIKGFAKVIEMETEYAGKAAEWSFKSLKKIIKLTLKTGDKASLTKRFNELLKYNSVDNGVSENDLFKGITRILDHVTATSTDTDLVLEMYDIALKQMKGKNENLWFKTRLKLAQRMFDKGVFNKLQPILNELEESCLTSDGKEDPKKANQLLDVYALAIQMYMEQKDIKKTKEMYEKGFEVSRRNPGILNSKLAIFHFVGGKLYMENHDWEKAYTAFFEAFNFFEEAGSKFKIPCLKYIVLSNMLTNSSINPFNSPDTLNLKNHSEIKPMSDLLDTYQLKDITRFEKILKDNKKVIMGDAFIAQFVNPVLREIRTQVLLQLIQPYTRVTLPFIAKRLNIAVNEVQELLVFLILDNKIEGQIDQINQLLKVEKGAAIAKYRHMSKWTDQLSSLHNTVLGKVN
jgi:COP9 signalosome complex subunit 2